jgi:ribosomal protein S18 acetylase RimI-like enzyme
MSARPARAGCLAWRNARLYARNALGRYFDAMDEIRTATIADVETVADTAARALHDEAMLRWSFGEDRFEERIRAHFLHYDGGNVAHGLVRMISEGAGIAVWIPPDAREAHEAIGPAPAGDTAILGDHAERHFAFWTWVEEHEPREPLLYLSHIAIAPERHGEGLGTALMRDGFETSRASALPIWLETSKDRNARFYEGLGFRTVVEEDAPGGGPHIWFMQRDPVTAASRGSERP